MQITYKQFNMIPGILSYVVITILLLLISTLTTKDRINWEMVTVVVLWPVYLFVLMLIASIAFFRAVLSTDKK
jgi:hypothetical protein